MENTIIDGFDNNKNPNEVLKYKLREYFDGKIVRKDLTKKIKEGANVPVYVLEFLLGQYCNTDNEEEIEAGVDTVKRILANNFVRPDEAQKILSVLRKNGRYTVIDMVSVGLNLKKTDMKQFFQILVLVKYQYQSIILKRMTGFYAEVYGVLFSLNMIMMRKILKILR